MEKGDAIVHFVEARNQYQWLYYTKDQDLIKRGKVDATPSKDFFNTKEEAVEALIKYTEENGFKKPSNIMYG